MLTKKKQWVKPTITTTTKVTRDVIDSIMEQLASRRRTGTRSNHKPVDKPRK